MVVASKTEQDIAKKFPLYNVDEIARAADATGVPFYIACTLFEMESKGKMIMGRDLNGSLTGYPGPFSEGQFDVFYWMVVIKNLPSNGYGASQVTHRNYLKDIKAKNIEIWDVYTNMKYGLDILAGHYKANGSWETAFLRYNGKQSYADTAVRKMGEWKKRLSVTTPAPAPTPTFRYHTVIKGDRPYLLAERYKVTTTEIYEANKLGSVRADGTPGIQENPNLIEIGQKLLIPNAP